MNLARTIKVGDPPTAEIPANNIQASGKFQALTFKLERTNKNRRRCSWLGLACVGLLMLPSPAQASLLHGETLDTAAEVLAWVVLIVAPAVGITVFWLLHIMPEKIAEKKQHPQTRAIQTLCLLSLVFGGLLWPIAWLWAYTKPVLHKMAYGTDTDETVGHGPPSKSSATKTEEAELKQLRARVTELESRLARSSSVESEKV